MEIKLPCLISFDDYHDIDYFAEKAAVIMPTLVHKEIGEEFIGEEQYYYWAVFWDSSWGDITDESIEKLVDKEPALRIE